VERVTTLKSEQIHAALHALVDGADGMAVVRNAALSDVGAEGVYTLEDGTAELVEEFFNPSIYEFTLTPSLFLILPLGEDDIDAALAAKIEAFATALEGAGELDGLVTAIRPQPPDMEPRELFGLPNMKGARLDIEVDYWSVSSLG
jgi:hypothetical protein